MRGIRVFLLELGRMWEPKTAADYTVQGLKPEEAEALSAEEKQKQTGSYAVLIDHPEAGWMLFDTGICPEPSTLWPEYIRKNVPCEVSPKEKMKYQLSLLGLRPEDIRYVITSHMHFDHIGNDALFAKTAEFFVSEAEAQFAYKTVLCSNDPDDHGWYVRQDVLLPRKKVTYLVGDHALFSGIQVFQLPGHTPGVMGMLVQAEGGALLFPSDAVKFEINVQMELPGGLYSLEAHNESMCKLKKLQKQYAAKLFYAHDMPKISEYKKAPLFYA